MDHQRSDRKSGGRLGAREWLRGLIIGGLLVLAVRSGQQAWENRSYNEGAYSIAIAILLVAFVWLIRTDQERKR
jgi:hypothetical protein